MADEGRHPVEQYEARGGNGVSVRSLVCRNMERKAFSMNSDKEKKTPPATEQRAPDPEIELKVKKHPEDKDAKADLGSDESMDASDPSSATQPGSSEPAPSSGFPD